MVKNGHTFGRLKPEVLASLSKEGFPKTRAFFTWMRRRPHPLRLSEHHYVRLRAGEVVPWGLLECLAQYLSDLRKEPYDTKQMADPSSVPPIPIAPRPTEDAWSWGWARLFSSLTKRFRIAEEAYCAGPDDLKLAARMVMECVGRAEANGRARLSAEEVLAMGERAMGRSLETYADWLRVLWQDDPRTVMFSVLGSKNGAAPRRFGVGVLAPLNHDAYAGFRKGVIEDSALTPSDLDCPSLRLLIDAAAQVDIDEARLTQRATVVQVHTFMFQMSMLLKELKRREQGASLVSLAGTPENEQRLRNYGFHPVGNVTPVSRRPIYELTLVEDVGPKSPLSQVFSRGQYDVMFAVLRLYQAMFAQERMAVD